MTTSSPKRQVVITGAALATPAGYSLAENYSAFWEGKTNFAEISRYNYKGSSIRYAGECAEPDLKILPDKKVKKILRRKDIISLITTINAANDSGIKPGQNIDPTRIGMYVGAGSTQIGDLTPYFTLVANCADMNLGTFDSKRFGRELLDIVNPLVVLQNLMNNGLCFGSMTLDLRGVNANFMDFQVAGLRAIGEGFRSIQQNRADACLCGGISAPVEPFHMGEGVKMGYLAKTNDPSINIKNVIKPFDKNRSGTVLSEGAAYVLLEEEHHALARGAKIYGKIKGFALANDGSFDLLREKESPGLTEALKLALNEAGIAKNNIGSISAHANGAISPDLAEAKAYLDVLGESRQTTPIHSHKAVFGEMSEAAGAASLVFALDVLRRGEIPPTYNFTCGDEYSSKLFISNTSQKCQFDNMVVTSRNMVGLCAAVVITK